MKPARIAKAIMAMAVAGLGSLQVGLTDNHLSLQEGITAGIAALAALGATYAVQNEPKPDELLDVPVNR